MNRIVPNIFTTALLVKTAHWNYKADNFYSVHELLDAVEGMLREQGDQLAERAVYLGLTPEVDLNSLEAYSDVITFNTEDLSSHQMVIRVVDSLEHLHALCDKVRGTWGSCEDSMLDTFQEKLGKYIYQLNQGL